MDQTLIARYKLFLEQMLTPRRLQHSYGVMQVMQELAEIYCLDREKAILAGFLHDAGKDLPLDVQRQIAREAAIQINEPCEQNYELYLHGPVGAYFVFKELGITDGLILDAISMHTYFGKGDNFNSPLVWCLRFSDILEPNRTWDNVRCIREGRTRLRKIVLTGS
jgi:predicted HD superfamily hydrolase involved in NAD metabolism